MSNAIKHHEYWIRTNPMNGLTWIERDGVFVRSCRDVAHAKRIIDGWLRLNMTGRTGGAS